MYSREALSNDFDVANATIWNMSLYGRPNLDPNDDTHRNVDTLYDALIIHPTAKMATITIGDF